MSKSIPISKKHGANPTIPVCFWCGEQKNEVALLGKLPGDVEAPKQMVLDYEPCDKCKEGMNTGITFIQALNVPATPNQPALQTGVYPTGTWCVIKEEAVKGFVTSPALLENILKNKKCFMDKETWAKVMPN